ncbi:MAG: hypothetical protein GDA42_07270, partial [Ekhidna sp.]|nr:hypothetical protein [Ekhidna sp.]
SKSIVQTQAVIIDDTIGPTVTGTLTEVTAQCPINDATELTKPPTPADNCNGTVNVALKSGTSFPIQAGNTTLTWVYTDDKGNTSEQTQTVTIDDNMPPTVTGNLAPVTAQCPISAETDLTEPDAPADNCGGTVNVALKSGTNFPITSNTSITWTYTDKAGNTTTQTQAVTITACVLSAADDAVEAVVFPNPSGRYVESGLYLIQLPDGRLLKFVKK